MPDARCAPRPMPPAARKRGGRATRHGSGWFDHDRAADGVHAATVLKEPLVLGEVDALHLLERLDDLGHVRAQVGEDVGVGERVVDERARHAHPPQLRVAPEGAHAPQPLLGRRARLRMAREIPATPANTHGIGSSQRMSPLLTTSPWTRAQMPTRPRNAMPITRAGIAETCRATRQSATAAETCLHVPTMRCSGSQLLLSKWCSREQRSGCSFDAGRSAIARADPKCG